MKLIVGLGNPGRKYAGTRHNMGFDVAGGLARQYAQGSLRGRFHAEVVEIRVGGAAALLVCPNTYMNRSGLSVREASDYYQIETPEILVVCDDMNLPLGQIRLRKGGSAGGQKGLHDIIRCLGSEQVPRLRVGIGRPPEARDPVDYVLGRFSAADRAIVDQAIARATLAVSDWLCQGIEYCMNHYNAAPNGGRAETDD